MHLPEYFEDYFFSIHGNKNLQGNQNDSVSFYVKQAENHLILLAFCSIIPANKRLFNYIKGKNISNIKMFLFP